MTDQGRAQTLSGWCLGTSAAAGATEAVTARDFVHAGIEVSVAENIGVNMGFELYLEEEWWRSLVGSRQYKAVEIGNAKKLWTELRKEAYESSVTVSKLGCNTCGK